MTGAAESSSEPGRLYAAAFEVGPQPMLLLDDQLEINAANVAARRELGPIESLVGIRCCA